jgi:hypothetical protein
MSIPANMIRAIVARANGSLMVGAGPRSRWPLLEQRMGRSPLIWMTRAVVQVTVASISHAPQICSRA